MSATEVIEEVIEDSVDVVEEFACLLSERQHVVRLITVGAMAGAMGGLFAYYIGNKRMEAKYAALAEEEIAEAKRFYSALNKKGDFATPEATVKKLIDDSEEVEEVEEIEEVVDAILKYQGKMDAEGEAYGTPEEILEEVAGVSIFLNNDRSIIEDDGFDYDEEMKTRNSDNPYIIHENEFLESVENYAQSSLTYYAGDDTLSDERDQVIPASDDIVGDENLHRFGHGSTDPRIVYIRNENLSTDFEVLLSDGKYANEVLGFQHSGRSGRDRLPKKFRPGDDE